MLNLNKIKWLSLFALLAFVSCSSDDGPAAPPVDTNLPPTVTFTFSKIAVAKSTDVTLTVATSDPEGDPVSVMWKVTRGLLNPADQGKTSMQWSTDGTAGTDTVTITATDGKTGMTTITEVVQVGTRRTTTVGANEIWNLAGSPYIVAPPSGTLVIPDGNALTIEAGVAVYVEPTTTINVDGGEMTIAGTAANPVTVTPNAVSPAVPFWGGVLATGAQPLLDFDHATISHAANAIKAVANTNVQINDCTIMLCSDDAILHESFGELVVEDTKIVNNIGSGIRVRLISGTPDRVVIRRDSIAVNGRFSDSMVYANGEAGITLSFDDPSETVSVIITNNEISRNDFPGIRLKTAVFPVINNNGIFGNELRKVTGKINMELLEPFASGEVNGTRNWWGLAYPTLADSVILKETIVDNDDNTALGATVSVFPWLDAY